MFLGCSPTFFFTDRWLSALVVAWGWLCGAYASLSNLTNGRGGMAHNSASPDLVATPSLVACCGMGTRSQLGMLATIPPPGLEPGSLG